MQDGIGRVRWMDGWMGAVGMRVVGRAAADGGGPLDEFDVADCIHQCLKLQKLLS